MTHATGLIPRDYAAVPLGSVEYAAKYDQPLIPRAEWPDRIADMERGKSRLSDICDREGIPCLDQNGYGYCHAFSPCYAVMAIRAAMGQPYKLLSASSIGGPVTGFRDAGAYIFDDLNQIVKFGVSSVDTYPMTTTKNHWTDAAKADAAKHKVQEWWDLENRNLDQVMTCLLSRIPVCVGLNWWGHAVTYLDPVLISPGKFGIRIQNSWGSNWESGGRVVYPEGYGKNHSTPDEAYAPRLITGAA